MKQIEKRAYMCLEREFNVVKAMIEHYKKENNRDEMKKAYNSYLDYCNGIMDMYSNDDVEDRRLGYVIELDEMFC